MNPLAFVLISRKTQISYDHVFKYLHEHVFDMSCRAFMTDFESAMRNSLRQMLPAIPVNGCWFHYSQALQRRATNLKNFVGWLKGNKTAATVFRKFYHLPLLPADKINTAFQLIAMESKRFSNRLFNEFVSYVERQWIIKVEIFLRQFILF